MFGIFALAAAAKGGTLAGGLTAIGIIAAAS